jgi:4-nitrophenyl phosphatase
MNLATLKTLLLDGDGVLWRANDAIPGLNRFFDVLAQRTIRWALLTNNNTRTVDDYVQKLRGFGVEADASHVFTSSTVTAEYLEGRYGHGAPVHVVGMSGLIDTLVDAGFRVTHGEEIPPDRVVAVAAGMDRGITHEKIKIAMRLILGGAEFVATNTDGSFPTPDGLNPGTGMVIGALQAVTERQPVIIGKPEAAIYEAAMRHFGADPSTTSMLGDRLETDIVGAQRVGIGSIAVLTGVVTREQLAVTEIQPDLVFESIADLADALAAVAIV